MKKEVEKDDFGTSSWMEKEKQKHHFVGMLCPSLGISVSASLPPVKTQVYAVSSWRDWRQLRRS